MKMRRRIAILLFIGFIGGAAMACNSSDESSTHSNEVVDMKEVSLFTAIKNNNLTAVKQLLESKVDIEQRNEKERLL